MCCFCYFSARSIDGLQRQLSPRGLRIASMNFMPGVQMHGLISCLQFHSYLCELHSAPREGSVEQLIAENHVGYALSAFSSHSTLRTPLGAKSANYNNSDKFFFNFRDLDFGFNLRRLEKYTQEQKEWIILVYSE